jgi:dTMP kinase
MFITFEGGEGSGKTTIIRNIALKFKEDQLAYIMTREPGGSPVSEQIRQVLLDQRNHQLTAEAEMLLFAAARAQHLNDIIIPALKEKKVVLCDRYLDSSIAYQAFGRNLGLEFVLKANTYALDYLPDLTIFLDVDPIIGQQRLADGRAHKMDRLDLESMEFHHKVKEGFEYLLKENPQRIIRVDANQSVIEITEQVYGIIRQAYARNT